MCLNLSGCSPLTALISRGMLALKSHLLRMILCKRQRMMCTKISEHQEKRRRKKNNLQLVWHQNRINEQMYNCTASVMLSHLMKVSMVCLYADTSMVMFKWVAAPEDHRRRVCLGVGRAYEIHLSHAQSWPWGRAWTGNRATAGVWWIGSLLACTAHRSLGPVSISIDLLWLIKNGDMFSVKHTAFQR